MTDNNDLLLQNSADHIAAIAAIDLKYNALVTEQRKVFKARHPTVIELEECAEWLALIAPIEANRQEEFVKLRERVWA